MGEQLVGTVTHYFGKPRVAIIEITDRGIQVGDTIHVVGHTSDFAVKVESMELEHASVESAGVGDSVGIEMAARARERDRVYLVD